MKKRLFTTKHLRFYISGTDEEAIYTEIFTLQTYKLNTIEDSVLMDIGLNVGLASLYFSTLKNIKKIYSYEPFQETYNLAIENINLNKSLKSKIIPHNFGLGNIDETSIGTCNPDYRGSASIIPGISPTGDTFEVILKSAGNELEQVISENPNLPIILKIDCEGGENKIFKDEKFLSLLSYVKEIVMETHRPEYLTEISNILISKNFSVNAKLISLSNGYLHAIK